jgi:hypothetical protein
MMGNRGLHKNGCLHNLGTLESEWLKVTALNLFHPTTSPFFKESVFPLIATQFPKGELRVRGISILTFCDR